MRLDNRLLLATAAILIMLLCAGTGFLGGMLFEHRDISITLELPVTDLTPTPTIY